MTTRTILQFLTFGVPALFFHLHAEPTGGSAHENHAQVVRPADELFWAPTLEQAIEIATANRVPIFVMG